MTILKDKKKIVAFIIWSIICSLFIFKYSFRISLPIAILNTIFFNIVLSAILWLCSKKKYYFSNTTWLYTLGGITIFSIFIFQVFPVQSIRVDRWEMIQIFWDSVHQGIYPYAVHSPAGNYPGPMPVYFLLSYPFYLIQEIGWMSILAMWLLYLYIKNRRLTKENNTFIFIIFISSITIYYEIVTRSTILFNSIIFLLYFLNLGNIEKQSKPKFYAYAILGGIIFSTRNIFIIPMILWGMKVILTKQMNLLKFTTWCLCFLFSFAITFLPFIAFDPILFLQYNPFITQGEMLIPFTHIIVFITVTFLIPIILGRQFDVIFLTVLLLFAIISHHVVYSISNIGIEAFLYCGADISYYIFCFPFIFEILLRREYDQKQNNYSCHASLQC